MASFNYKTESGRYRHYYRQLQGFYQKPIIQVSSAVLFTLITISFFAAFAIRPTLQTIAELLKTIKDQKQVLSLAQKKTASLATAQQQYEMIGNDISVLDTAIPKRYQVQSLLSEIESMTSNLGISLNNLRISGLQYPQKNDSSGAIQEIPFSISLDAPYPLVKKFLMAINQLPRFVVVNTVKINSVQEKQSTPSNTVELTANCTAYFVSESGDNNETNAK